MAGREHDPGPGPGPGPAAQERAVPVRSALLNRDSPDVESRRQRRRHRTQQVRFKDLVEGGVERAQSPPPPPAPTDDPDTPRASPPPRLGPEPAAPCASAAPRGWTRAQPCTPLQSRRLSQPQDQPPLQPLPQLQPLSQPPLQPQLQPLPQLQPQSQPQLQPRCQPQDQPLLQPLPQLQPLSQPLPQPPLQPRSQPPLRPRCQPQEQPSPRSQLQPRCQPPLQPLPQLPLQPRSQPQDQPQLQPLPQPQLQPRCQPQDQPSPQSQLQPPALPPSLLQPGRTRSSAAIQTSPSLQKPFVPPRAHSEGAQEAAAATGGRGAGVPRAPGAPCVPLPGAAACSAPGCAPATRCGSPGAERCPRAPGCARPRGGPPRPASVPCGRPPAAPRCLARSDSERSLRPHNPRPPRPPRPSHAAPAAGAHGPCRTAQCSPHRDPPRCSSPWGGPCCTPPPPQQDSLLAALGSAAAPKTGCPGPAAPGAQPGLTARQTETLRHVQDLLQLVAAANGQAAAPTGDGSTRTPQGQGPAGPGERGDLRTQLQSLEGVLETSQQTIRVLLDVIQDLEKKEAQRDGRLSYRTGQDIANCGTCRDCACIIYSVEHDFRQQEGRFQRVLSTMERRGGQGSPPGAPGPQEPSPGSRLPARLDAKKSRRKCFWFL